MRQIIDANTLDLTPGCYVEGSWGWRGAIHLLEQFEGVAYQLDDDDRALIERYGEVCDMADAEAMVDLADLAETMLNNALRPGLVASWRDGEFFVSEAHVGHRAHLTGAWYCDTCDSPYCDLA